MLYQAFVKNNTDIPLLIKQFEHM